MKKGFFLILGLLLIFSCKEEIKSRVTQAYTSGEKKREVEYGKDGKTVVSQTVYQEDGKVLMQGPMKEDKRDGEWRFYDYEGTLKSVRQYKIGVYDGKYIEYYKSGGISIDGMYANGDRVGEWKKYDEAGKEIIVKEKTVITPLTPNFSNEKITETYPDGTTKTKIVFDETGTKKMSQKTYYASGETKIIGEFKEDKRSGKWTSFHENGKTLSINYFLEGEFHGDYMLYHESGIIKIEGEYNYGTMTGSWKSYNSDATLLSHEFYDAKGLLMDKIK